MPDDPTLVYLEPDEEITSVVRRVRGADAGRVVLVAPGRAKATSSATALRLLARVASEDGRDVSIVGDALTRSLAAEAEIAAFSSVGDALGARTAEPVAPRHAVIHVLRGDEPTAAHPAPAPVAPALAAPAPAAPARPPATAAVPTGRGDETRIVPLARSQRAAPGPAPTRRRRSPAAIAGIVVLVLAFLVVAAGAAAMLPSATVAIEPATQAVGPRTYELEFDDPAITSGTIDETVDGRATGTYPIQSPATGNATFRNFNIVAVEVAAGTQVSASSSGIAFLTTASVVVPGGTLTENGTIAGGEAAAPIQAIEIGPSGNLTARAIDTIDSNRARNSLRGFANNTARLVINYEATAGGVDDTGIEVTQADVDAAVAELRERLAAGMAQAIVDSQGITVDQPAEPQIDVPRDLVGRRDEAAFTLAGSVAYDRATVEPAGVEAAARQALDRDGDAVPEGHELLADTFSFEPGDPTRSGDAVTVPVVVTARSAPTLDEEQIRRDIAGRQLEEARAMLAPIGEVTISTWPDWVDAVPALEWRIEVTVAAPNAPAPGPSGSDAPSR
jgi:hypothetical protein